MELSAVTRKARVLFALIFYSLFWLTTANASVEESREPTLLLRQPAISKTHLAFVYAGDIWLAGRDGGKPRRLTTHPANEELPKFSPDGQWIAFSADYNNNRDVYIVSVNGGLPKRLTWHPGNDFVNGWTPDGKNVVFTSHREIRNSRSDQLYHVAISGGFPQKQMQAVVYRGAWSPDGKRLAFQPYRQAHNNVSGWRLHRGGATPPIWIIDPDTQVVEKIPHQRASDISPMWLGDSVYFISDRDDRAANLFAYDTTNKSLTQLTKETQWDIHSADTYGDSIVYEVGGRLKELNVITRKTRDVAVHIPQDSSQLRPQWKQAEDTLQHIALSPTGKRALITARGEVFSVPLEEGATRNLTKTGAVRESDAIWSPNGESIAYITEEGFTHKLIVAEQTGKPRKRYDLGGDYYSLLAWSGDSKRIIYQDNHLNLYALTLKKGRKKLVDSNRVRFGFNIAMSGDGRWMAYTKAGENLFHSLFLYDFETGKRLAITDSMSEEGSPAFSRDGQYLFFTVSTNAGPLRFFELSSLERPLRSGIYALMLAADGKPPLPPETGDEYQENGESEKKEKDEQSEGNRAAPVKIDLDGIQQRIVALPIAKRNYDSLAVADDGMLYFVERLQPGISRELPDAENRAVHKLYRFDFEKRETSLVQEKIAHYFISADGKHLLIQAAKGKLLSAKVEEKIKTKPLSLADMKVFVDPKREWEQIFNEVWRMEQAYFYAPNMHGLNWDAVYERYHALLKHVSTREDLNQLLVEMVAELQVGHNRVGGGDVHKEQAVDVGLLGADIRLQNGYYRIAKIYTGERWNPFLKAPLAVPGLGVAEGDYILAVNGVAASEGKNIFALFENTAGKQVTLTVNSKPRQRGSRDVVVEPIAQEDALRQWAWIEDNRRYVAQATDNRVGYVYLPDTHDGGYTYFNRMFFPQNNKQALIIDERKNNGGFVDDYVNGILSQTKLSGWKERDGINLYSPQSGMFGPKVMLIDQDAGSGGDYLPYSFRRKGIGKLIGTRTWGGLIGISANPALIDGGRLSVPFIRFYTPEKQWRIENEGVAPDIEVELEPEMVNRGVDTQLDRAITEVLKQLRDHKTVKPNASPALPRRLGM